MKVLLWMFCVFVGGGRTHRKSSKARPPGPGAETIGPGAAGDENRNRRKKKKHIRICRENEDKKEMKKRKKRKSLYFSVFRQMKWDGNDGKGYEKWEEMDLHSTVTPTGMAFYSM